MLEYNVGSSRQWSPLVGSDCYYFLCDYLAHLMLEYNVASGLLWQVSDCYSLSCDYVANLVLEYNVVSGHH